MKYIKDGIIYNEVKYVAINGMGISNPTHEQILSCGYEVYVEPQPTPQQLLEEAKQNKIYQIEIYDKSESVNSFYLGNTQMWLDKETRTGLRLRFESEENAGRTDTTLWYNNVCYSLPIETAKYMLNMVEVYASDCYDMTAQHKVNVLNLISIEDVDNYDYTLGYPEKLSFPYNL